MISRISMKTVVLYVLMVSVDCLPLSTESSQVTRYEYEHLPDNAYHFVFELSDGQKRDENGSFKKVGDQLILAVDGSFSFIGDDGKEYNVQYTGDENGFKASGDHLPGKGTGIILPPALEGARPVPPKVLKVSVKTATVEADISPAAVRSLLGG